MSKTQRDPPFTFPKLSQLIDILIGDANSVVLPRKYSSLAELLEIAARDTYLCAIQWTDETGNTLQSPVLWRYAKWVESTEKWQRAKDRSDKERVERFIFAANVAKIAMACERYFLMDHKFAEATAYSALTKKRVGLIKELGIKLIEKEEEL